MRRMLVAAQSVIVLLGFVHPAGAHGPQIQLTADSGKIVTRRLIRDEPYGHKLTPPTAVYVLPVAEISGIWLVRPNAMDSGLAGTAADSNGPGIAIGQGYLDSTTHPFKSGMYSVTFTDGLMRWDGAAFADAGSTQFEVYKNTARVATADDGPFATLSWNVTMPAADQVNAHSGLSYRFLGDGLSPTSELPNGVYLASMQISHRDLDVSNPYFFVMPKGTAPSSVIHAVNHLKDWAGIDPSAIQFVVPEPSAAALWAFAMVSVASRHRSNFRFVRGAR